MVPLFQGALGYAREARLVGPYGVEEREERANIGRRGDRRRTTLRVVMSRSPYATLRWCLLPEFRTFTKNSSNVPNIAQSTLATLELLCILGPKPEAIEDGEATAGSLPTPLPDRLI